MNRWLSKIVALLTILAATRLSQRRSSPAATADLSAVVRRNPANFGETSPKLREGGKVGTTLSVLIVKHPWIALGAVGGVLAVGAFLVVVSGIVPIKASSGHWKITEVFLQFAKRRSVATHSIGIKVPPLDDRAMILKGAGHFEGGCRPCHGRPGEPPPKVPQAMTPKAPPLASRLRTWEMSELFYIVKHGIKLTGMPAWPVPHRDDEVWAIVAFLRVFPDVDRAEYLRLVNGDTPPTTTTPPIEALSAVSGSCGRCHGLDGRGREVGAFPRLAGQSETYLLSALKAFAGGRRHSGIMAPIAIGLDEETMREVAFHYSRRGQSETLAAQESTAAIGAPTERSRGGAYRGAAAPGSRNGAEIAQRGIPAKKVPSCADCHGPTKKDRNPAYPELAGQYPEYLVLQLQLFARRERGGSEYAHLMPPVAAALTTEEMMAVAQYYASLPR